MSEQTAEVIKAVRKRPFLFDTSHENYKNILRKAQAWEEIAAELDTTSEVVKLKWKNLRDSYIRHKKSILNGKGHDRKYMKWPWSSQMMFLDNYCLRGKTQNPRMTVIRDVRQPTITVPGAGVSEYKPLKIPLQKETTVGGSPPAETSPNKNVRPQERDAVDHLFLSYSETFKKFRPATQAVIKLQLATLFSRTELNELQEKELSPQKVSRLMTVNSHCDGRAFLLKSNGVPQDIKPVV